MIDHAAPAGSVFMGGRVEPGHPRVTFFLVFAGLTREPMHTERGLPQGSVFMGRRIKSGGDEGGW